MKSAMILGLLSAGAIAAMAACSTGDDDVSGAKESDIAIDKASEDPAKLLGPDYETRLSKLIIPADIGKEYGLDDTRVPYPDTFWPFLYKKDGKVIAKNGIDDRWQSASEASPLEKYMALVDPSKVDAAREWEAQHHGEHVAGVANWFGHCNGWTAAAMYNPPVREGVSVKRGDAGEIVRCGSKDEPGCQTFEIGDINALEAEVFLSNSGSFLGARCDTKPADIPRDEHGRVLKNGCRGLNPGALVIVLANRLKNVKNDPNFVPKAIAIDAQNEANTDQVWNQPAYRFEVHNAESLNEQMAIEATTKGTNRPTKYPFNSAAKGWVRVDVSIKWVTEEGPNYKFVSGLASTKTTRFIAILELDGEPQFPETKVIGGEFIDNESVDANRLTVPPFVWTTDGPLPDNLARSHNPFVKGSQVGRIVDLALKR